MSEYSENEIFDFWKFDPEFDLSVDSVKHCFLGMIEEANDIAYDFNTTTDVVLRAVQRCIKDLDNYVFRVIIPKNIIRKIK